MAAGGYRTAVTAPSAPEQHPSRSRPPGVYGFLVRAFIWLRFFVAAGVIAAAVAAGTRLPGVANLQSSPLGVLTPRNTPAEQTEQWMLAHFRAPLTPRAAVVQRNPHGLGQAQLTHTAQVALAHDRAAERDGGRSGYAFPISNVGGVFPGARESGTTAITYLMYPPAVPALRQIDLANRYAGQLTAPGAPAYPTGVLAGELGQARAINDSLTMVEIATIAAIVVILAVYFRSVGAPILTVVTAGIAYVIASHVVTWAGGRTGRAVPQELEPLIVVLLLGIVTDYSVFFLAGMRRRLRAGASRVDSAVETTALFFPIILTAGLLVAAGVATLSVGSIEFFRTIGPAMAATVLIGLAVSLCFLPASIAIFGRWLLWPGLGPHRNQESPAEGEPNPRFARLFRHRYASALLALLCCAGLLVAATGITRTALGFDPIHNLPKDWSARRGEDQASQGFAGGILAPTVVLLRGPGVARRAAQVADLESHVRRLPGVAGVIGADGLPASARADVFQSTSGDAVRFLVIFDSSPYGAPAIASLQNIQSRMPGLIRAASLSGVRPAYAGDTPIASDTISTIHRDLLRIGLVVLAINLLVLIIFLRSVLAPLLLTAASMLSVLATFGLTTYVFQTWLGQSDLTYYVPLAAGVLLVSLGSDYNVFLVGRIRQRARDLPLREAVTLTSPAAGRAISTAGIALAASFAMLALVPLESFAELAFALAVGVMLDTFVVRPLLVPALFSTIGDSVWWPRRRAPAHERVPDRAALPSQ
jgi:putative drug exporter of the RND superfamily